MKVKILMGSLVLGASLCTPSFGGGLLDRMLGMRGAGCDSACCDTGCSAAPSCGCEIAPSCDVGCADACAPACGGGLLSRLKGRICDSGCASAPSCGCEIAAPACDSGCSAAPSCGCEIAAPACGSGCGAAPSCGCEIASCDPCGSACDVGCKPRRRPLMELLGKAKCSLGKLGSRRACCDSGCADACAAPTCGCEIAACDPCAAPSCGCEIAACDPCAAPSCGRSCGGLLGKLFQRKNRCCDSMVASCDTGCASGGCSSGCSSCGGGSVSYPSSSAPVAAPEVHGDAAPMPPAPIVDPSAYLQSNRRVIQATSYVR
jgi:hypothetical protein